MSKSYRGYYIQWSAYENCYQVRKYQIGYGNKSIVVARRESEGEAKMFIDDTLDGTTKEDEYERKQVKGGI